MKKRTNEREQSVRPSGRSAGVGHGFPLGLHLPPLPPLASRTFSFVFIFFVGFNNFLTIFLFFLSPPVCSCSASMRWQKGNDATPGTGQRVEKRGAGRNMQIQTCTWTGHAHVCVRVCVVKVSKSAGNTRQVRDSACVLVYRREKRKSIGV